MHSMLGHVVDKADVQPPAGLRPVARRLTRGAQPSEFDVAQPAAAGGQPIAAPVRAPLERAFGESFAGVRIHSSTVREPLGLTQGEHVTFAHGRYEPESVPGRLLLAHELTHVVQQRRGSGVTRPTMTAPAAEAEADRVAERAATGRPVRVSGARQVGPAANDSDWRSLLSRAREVVVHEVRQRTGEALGTVEGVATEVATAADTLLWASSRGLSAVDAAVDRASHAAGLTPAQQSIAHAAVETTMVTLIPSVAPLRHASTVARATGLVDPVTGTPSLAVGVGRLGDALDRRRIAVVGQGQPEYGIFTAREMGQLEGALGSQIALLFVDAEEVQLALRGIAGLGALQAIDHAMSEHPDSWPHERDFWFAVAGAALFLIGLHASSVGARLRELMVDAGLAALSTSGVVLTLARDYRDYHQPDRDRRIAADTQAVVRALASGIITAINHARQARARSSAPSGPETQASQTRQLQTATDAHQLPVAPAGQVDAHPVASPPAATAAPDAHVVAPPPSTEVVSPPPPAHAVAPPPAAHVVAPQAAAHAAAPPPSTHAAPRAPHGTSDRLFSEGDIEHAIGRLEDTAEPIGQGLRSRRRVSADIDEPIAVSKGGAWDDPANKRFLESITNRLTKNDLTEVAPTAPTGQISLRAARAAGDAEFRRAARAMLDRNFSQVDELAAVTMQARSAMQNTNRPVGRLRNAINRSIRRRIARGSSPEAQLVNEALRVLGIDPRGISAGRD